MYILDICWDNYGFGRFFLSGIHSIAWYVLFYCCCLSVLVVIVSYIFFSPFFAFLSQLLLWDANEMMTMIVRDGGRSSGLSMRQFQIHIYCYLFSAGVCLPFCCCRFVWWTYFNEFPFIQCIFKWFSR